MLVKPSPRPCAASCGSKPTPESCTVRRTSSEIPMSDTLNCLTQLCFIAFCRSSCKTRYRHKDISGERSLGMSLETKSITTPCRSESSLQKPAAADASPRVSNLDECNWCDKD